MKDKIIAVIRENLIEIMPELEGTNFTNDTSFVDLGANSIDRGELITLTLEKLDLDVSRIAFVNTQTINDLAESVAKYYNNNQ